MGDRWWWLSFADANRPKGTQFLGAVLVRAGSMIEAVGNAHILGINPGGEVRGFEIPDGTEPIASYTNRLLNREECEQFDREMLEARR